MTKNIPAHSIPAREISPRHPFRGAIINDEGREIPITESMIQEACRRLETASRTVYPPREHVDPGS